MDGLSIKKYPSRNSSIPAVSSSIVLNQFEFVTLYLMIFQQVSMQFSCGLYGGKNSIKMFSPSLYKYSLDIFALWAGPLSKTKTYFLLGSKVATNRFMNSKNECALSLSYHS